MAALTRTSRKVRDKSILGSPQRSFFSLVILRSLLWGRRVMRQKRLQEDYTLGGNSGFKTVPKYYDKMIISLSLVVC